MILLTVVGQAFGADLNAEHFIPWHDVKRDPAEALTRKQSASVLTNHLKTLASDNGGNR